MYCVGPFGNEGALVVIGVPPCPADTMVILTAADWAEASGYGGVTAEQVAIVIGWGFGVVLLGFLLGYVLGLSLGLIKKV